jgi:hypothetical protein
MSTFVCGAVLLQVAAKELLALLAKPSLDGIPLLVLGNKNDLPGALGTQQLIQQLELQVGFIIGLRVNGRGNTRTCWTSYASMTARCTAKRWLIQQLVSYRRGQQEGRRGSWMQCLIVEGKRRAQAHGVDAALCDGLHWFCSSMSFG